MPSSLLEAIPNLRTRQSWEEPGYRMAFDFTRLPILFNPAAVTQNVAHYTAAANVPDGDTGERQDDIIRLLRNMERDYLTNRTGGGYVRKSDGRFFPGYHTGYAVAIDWLGTPWEIRGVDFLPAATNGHNGYTFPILFLTDGAAPATAAQWQTARLLGRFVRELYLTAHKYNPPRPFIPQFTDHGLLYITTGIGTPTACSGAGIRPQALSSLGNIDYDAPPPPPAPPITGDEMRILILTDAGNQQVLLTGHVATLLDPGRYAAFHAAYPKIVDEAAAVSWLINCVFTGPLPSGVTKDKVWQHQP